MLALFSLKIVGLVVFLSCKDFQLSYTSIAYKKTYENKGQPKFRLLFQKGHVPISSNHDDSGIRNFALNSGSKNTSYLDIIFETNRYSNTTKIFKSRNTNSSRSWLPTSIVRQFSVAEAAMRRISQRSFSVINGSMAGDVGFDPLGERNWSAF